MSSVSRPEISGRRAVAKFLAALVVAVAKEMAAPPCVAGWVFGANVVNHWRPRSQARSNVGRSGWLAADANVVAQAAAAETEDVFRDQVYGWLLKKGTGSRFS